MGTTIRTLRHDRSRHPLRERFKDSTNGLLNIRPTSSPLPRRHDLDISSPFLRRRRHRSSSRPTPSGATASPKASFFVEDPRETGGRKDLRLLTRRSSTTLPQRARWEINEQSAANVVHAPIASPPGTGRPRFVAGAIGPSPSPSPTRRRRRRRLSASSPSIRSRTHTNTRPAR